MWEYLRAYSRCKLGPVPVPIDADLKTETKWAHPESTSRRPVLISDCIQDSPMRFVSSVLTRSGRTFHGEEGGSTFSLPFLVEHRLGLETTIKTKSRLIQQTRLIQIQPTLIAPGCERNWKPCLVVSWLGKTYSHSRSSITGAVHAYLQQFLHQVDDILAERYLYSAQFEWTYIQSPLTTTTTSTQPVGHN
jgi:hypothetical protein